MFSFRYLAICHGLRCHVTGKMARIIIVLIWSFATSVMSPWAVFYQLRPHERPQMPTGNTSDVTVQSATTTSGLDAEYVEYVCAQHWPSARMERNYFLAAIFVTCYTIPLVVISVCYALIARRVCNRGTLGLHDGGGQTVVQRSKVDHTRRRTPELVQLLAATCGHSPLKVIEIGLPYAHLHLFHNLSNSSQGVNSTLSSTILGYIKVTVFGHLDDKQSERQAN